MIKIIGLFKFTLKVLRIDNNNIFDSGNSRANKIVVYLSKSKKLKITRSKISICINIKTIKKSIFLIFDTINIFNYLI